MTVGEGYAPPPTTDTAACGTTPRWAGADGNWSRRRAGKADLLKEGAAALAKDGVVDTGDVVAVCRRSSGRATGSHSR